VIPETIGLQAKHLNLLQEIFSRYPQVEQVKLYGSRAKGTFNDRSDIDLVVYGDNIDRKILGNINHDLEESDIPYLVDLQQYESLTHQALIQEIDRSAISLFQLKDPQIRLR
jgi:predicted nucleotidyltransferase